jgi:hypothetical protein
MDVVSSGKLMFFFCIIALSTGYINLMVMVDEFSNAYSLGGGGDADHFSI